MNLKPSEIRFSQDSINNYFDKRSSHSYKTIGNTLDDLCEGRCSITNIPTITVVNEGPDWITADNRRLWVFRELERLGKCDTIPVQRGYSIPSAKRTSRNGGKSIFVRRNPGGIWHSKPTVRVDSFNHSVGNPSTHNRTEDRDFGTPMDNQLSEDVRRTASAHLRPEYGYPSPTPSTSHRPEYGYPSPTVSAHLRPEYGYPSPTPSTSHRPEYGYPSPTVSAHLRPEYGYPSPTPSTSHRPEYGYPSPTVSAHLRPEYGYPSPTPSTSHRPEYGYPSPTVSAHLRPGYGYPSPTPSTSHRPEYGYPIQSGLNEIDSLGLCMARMRLKTDESEQVSRINSSGSRVSRYSYGVRIRKSYIPGKHPKERKCVVDGEKMCRGCFDKHIEKRQKIEAGQSFGKKRYYPHSSNPKRAIYIYRSDRTYQTFTDDPSCSYIGKVMFDLSDVPVHESREYEVKMVYDGSEIRVTVRIIATGQRFKATVL